MKSVRAGKHQASGMSDFIFSWSFMKWNALIILFCIFVFSLNKVKETRYFPVNTVKIYGVEHVDRQEIQHLVRPLVSNGFFAVDVSIVKERLLQLPWVAEAAVRRVWPDQIIVQLIEQHPLARWNESSLLSTRGELFVPQGGYPLALPTLVGPEGQQMVVMDYLLKINAVLLPLHIKVARLELTSYDTWNLTLDNGIKLILGQKDILTRLDHFVKVYARVVGSHASDVESVDLRYSNGLAVRWKSIT